MVVRSGPWLACFPLRASLMSCQPPSQLIRVNVCALSGFNKSLSVHCLIFPGSFIAHSQWTQVFVLCSVSFIAILGGRACFSSRGWLPGREGASICSGTESGHPFIQVQRKHLGWDLGPFLYDPCSYLNRLWRHDCGQRGLLLIFEKDFKILKG